MNGKAVYMYTCTYTCTLYVKGAVLCKYMYMCAMLLCLVCLFAFACFFLSSFSHLSLKHVYILGLVFGALVVSLPRPSPSY